MRYAKAIAVGVATAVTAAILWIVLAFILPIAAPALLARFSNDGSGAAYASITSGSIAGAALVGFVAGFWWKLRR